MDKQLKKTSRAEQLAQSAKSIVELNELELDKECVRLPSDYLKYAVLSADLKKKVDLRKGELELAEARLSKLIRDTPGKYGMDKVTEASISACILTQEEYQTAVRLLNAAKHEQEVCQAIVWALEHKKRSLSLLVDLHGMGYFANPEISERGREVLKKMTQDNVRPRRRTMDQD